VLLAQSLDQVDQLPLSLELREDEPLLQPLVVVLDELADQGCRPLEDFGGTSSLARSRRSPSS
jgi:hypothetical protein